MTAMLGVARDDHDALTLISLGVDIILLEGAAPATRSELNSRAANIEVWRRAAGRENAATGARIDTFVAPAERVADLAAPDRAPVFAIAPPDRIGDEALFDELARAQARGVMLAPATDRRLLDLVGVADLQRFVRACRSQGLASALRGGLEAADIPRLLALGPDILAFDRALFGRGLQAAIDGQSVTRLRSLIPRIAAPSTEVVVGETDRVFVRDFVVDMDIGLYERERSIRQPVRFSVEVDIVRPDTARPTFEQVFSYDILTDRIRMLAAERRDLVETVAEEVAEAALAHPRVVRVTVRVEKLAVIDGSVGVEIVRGRR